MVNKYIVTSTGVKNGNPYSILSLVRDGVKENGDTYEFIDNNSASQREAEKMVLGTIVEYELSRVVPKKSYILKD